MLSNPFAEAPAAPPAACVGPASRLAYGIALVCLLASLLADVSGWALYLWSLSDGAGQRWGAQQWGDLFEVVQEALLAGVTGLCIARYWFERNSVGGHSSPVPLLLVLLVVGALLWGVLPQLIYPVAISMLERLEMLLDGMALYSLGGMLIGWLIWLLAGPLAVSLLLKAFRRGNLRDPQALLVPRGEVALTFGFLVLSVLLVAVDILLIPIPHLQDAHLLIFIQLGTLLAGLVAFGLAWGMLPPQVLRLRPLRLLAAAVAGGLLWSLVSLLLATLLVIAVLIEGSDLAPWLLIALGLLLVILLAGFCYLGLRLIYRPQAG